MPLLRKQLFEKQALPEYLRDDEEVFYCDITNEIFRDYQDFSERMFLCNSMVWTCSLTGKSNLTYQEALESEDHARQSLKEFPNEIKLPILYLATLTKRTCFGDMAEDVFLYAKDRYFIGENIEASFGTNKWKDCHILSVVAPKETQENKDIKNGSSPERNFVPSASLYKYEIEHLDAEDNDISEIMIVNSSELRRRKQHFSREKCKLFLKQCIHQDEQGIFNLKPEIIEKFSLKNVKWDQIFDGPLPNFQSSKRFEKAVNGFKKKQKQETLAKYLQKNGLVMKGENKEKVNNGKKNNLLEQMKKREEEFKIKKQMNDEQKAALKEKKRIETNKLEQHLKVWVRRKDDLELEDQVKLPVGAPVKMKIPDIYFGDVLSIMEFVHTFSSLLSVEDFFPHGLTLDTLERALNTVEIAGPLNNMIQMFLTAIFNLQEEESRNYSTPIENIKDEENVPSHPKDLKEATLIATLAAKWQRTHYGFFVNKLPIHNLTVSEILRLHLLSSGARLQYSGYRWRYSLRGGYTSEDDPALHLMLNDGHILKDLEVQNVVELSISDKVKILLCLINQLLTYADLRDVTEEKIEKAKELKHKLKMERIALGKRVNKLIADKIKLKKELKDDKAALNEAIQKLQEEHDKKEAESEKIMKKLLKDSSDWQPLIGRDRAYRQYLRIESVPGLFIYWEDDLTGSCLEKVTIQYPELINATKGQLKDHIKRIYGLNGDKENSPSMSPKKINGVRKSLVAEESQSELLMCTADSSTCPVHCTTTNRIKWSFLYDKQQFFDLIKSLNKRGIRENELKERLSCDEEGLISLIEKTPISILNTELGSDQKEEDTSTEINDIYVNANLGNPSDMPPEEVLENVLIEHILDMELKIHECRLTGTVKIIGREEWRNCLRDKNYKKFKVMWQEEIEKSVQDFIVPKKNGQTSRSHTPDGNSELQSKMELSEDGEQFQSEHSNIPNNVTKPSHKKVIHSLAYALIRLAYCIPAKYLKQPLGHADQKNNKATDVHDNLRHWEESLRASTSFSQVFLHYDTLESCVMWPKSFLQGRCQICRREKDSDNMLRCDSCNLAHHISCLNSKISVRPRTSWFCDKCKMKAKFLDKKLTQRKKRVFVEEEVEEEESPEESEESGEEEESDEEIKIELCKTCGSGGEIVICDKCSSGYHKECVDPPLRRFPRNGWTCSTCTNFTKQDSRTRDKVHRNGYYKETDSGDEFNKSSGRRAIKGLRRDDARDDLPLNNAALQDLLTDVMKHKDAWPFIRKVQKNEVPDYFDIITNPMDFGTIKNKLNMGEYSTDSQVMKDIELIFENCNTYNSSSDEVYKCGERLLSYVSTQGKKYGFKVPDVLQEGQSRAKKRKVK